MTRAKRSFLTPWWFIADLGATMPHEGDIDPVNSYFRVERALTNNKRTSACRGEGSVTGLQLRVRAVPAALLAMVRAV